MKKRIGLAIVVVALLVGLSEAFAERSLDLRLPPPSFRAAPGWLTVTTGPMKPTPFAPQVWAITERSNLGALVPFALFNSLRYLSPGGILVWATTSGRGGPTPVFTRGRLPLRLQSFRVDHGWEGQPKPNVQQRLRWISVGGWRLDIRVYFGTQRPSHSLVAAAQQELNRLRLPGR